MRNKNRLGYCAFAFSILCKHLQNGLANAKMVRGKEGCIVLSIIETGIKKPERPVKVVQFGEGNFLRAFVDYMFDILNEKTDFNGSIAIVKPIEYGSVEAFTKQDSIYTVCLRGLENGEEKTRTRIITSISKTIACGADYNEYAELAKLDTLRFVVSNTTEAGIVFDENDKYEMCPPSSYPGKLTKFLYERYKHFDGDTTKGLIILPVELIDENGKELKRCVKKLSECWKLGAEFVQWLDEACVFASTLVDRIVTGYPHGEDKEMFEKFGYEDKLLVTGELFALWVIESDKEIKDEIPFDKAGLPVIFTDDHKPYKQRKVRILNGAHTSFSLASYLAGNDYVGQSMDDKVIYNYMDRVIFEEIIPTLELSKKALTEFADSVKERFKNPFIKHALLSISLNSVSKWRARCMPSLLGYVQIKNEIPKGLAFSLAALIAFYSSDDLRDGVLVGKRNGEEYLIKDDAKVLQFFADKSSENVSELTKLVLKEEDFWGRDLTEVSGLEKTVADFLAEIRNDGMRAVMEKHFL